MSIQLTLTHKHADVIMKALDFYSRILAGQFDELLWQKIPHDSDNKSVLKAYATSQDIQDLLKELHKKITGLSSNSNWGITNEHLDKNAQTAYDIYCVIRHGVAWNKNPKGDCTSVSYDRPLHVNKKVPLCEISIDSNSISFIKGLD